MKKLLALCLLFANIKADSSKQDIQLNKFHYMDFFFLDILGNPKCITLPMDKAQNACKYGIFFDGSSVLGYTSINESDLLARPDTHALFVLPWGMEETSSLAMMCDICTIDGNLSTSSPRTILKHVVKDASNQGFSPYFGVEIEFYLLKKNDQGGYVPVDAFGYCEAMPNYVFKNFQTSLVNALKKTGIDVEKVHHEVAHGQYEVVLKYTDPIHAADSLVMTKYIIQAAAQSQGLLATFMPKPFAHQNGSGMHMHVSFFDKETENNAFYNEHAKNSLSDIGLHFIAGNLNRLKQCELLLNTSVNSFKRLVPGYEAPVYLCWGSKNRSAALRIPDITKFALHDTHGAPMRVEFRIPDGSCNPYLAFAAIIEAGLQGIKNKEKAPEPIEHNLYHYSEDEIAELGISTIATSLGEALDEYKNSEFVQLLLGGTLYNKILEIKEKELSAYSKNEVHNAFVITDWERNYHSIQNQE